MMLPLYCRKDLLKSKVSTQSLIFVYPSVVSGPIAGFLELGLKKDYF